MAVVRASTGDESWRDERHARGVRSPEESLRSGSLGRIRWLAIVLPALAMGLFEFLRHAWLAPVFPLWLGSGWFGNVVGALVVAGTVYVFVRVFSRMIENSAVQAARAREEAAVLTERQRMAREMHDGVAQTLFYLTVKLREVDALMPSEGSEPARGELLEAETKLEETYGQVREVVADLKRQAELEDFPEAVRRAARLASERLGLQVDCRVDYGLDPAASHKQHLLAIIQEALSNARRHGHAKKALVRAQRAGEQLVLEVTDEGDGFNPDTAGGNGGYGLSIMAERAQMVGGELSVDSSPGHGACVTVRLPEARAWPSSGS